MFVLRRIYDTAVATPDKPALVYNNQATSYADLWRLVESCRRALAPHTRPGGVALVAVTNLLEGWILNLALRSLGLDTAAIQSAGQVELFADQTVACVVTLESDPRPGLVAPDGATHLTLANVTRSMFGDEEPLPAFPDMGPAGGHYLLTSGTTGRPKPIQSRAGDTDEAFGAIMKLTAALADSFAENGDSTTCLFDLGLWTVAGYLRPIMTWSRGGAVVLDQRGGHHLALEWPGITHIVVTPYYLGRVMAAPEGAFAYRPQARLIVSAGALTSAMAHEAQRRLTPRIVVNVGSTEVGMWARSIIETDDDLLWHQIAPGRIVQVVDEAGEPLPPGRLGEVRVALQEKGRASHLGDAASTAKVFDNGWFRPGDLGVFDDRGRISLRGRAADVINVNGLKVPTDPWERSLQETLSCDGVCVLSGRFRGDVEQLHVFIESSTPISRSALIEAVRTTLYGFPDAQVHKIDAMPRTPLGKIRRIDLAQQLQDGAFQAGPEAQAAG